MAISEVYALHSVGQGGTNEAAPTVLFDAVSSVEINTGIDLYEGGESGGIDALFIAAIRAEPTISFDTKDIGAAFTAVNPINGVAISATEKVWLYFKKRAANGTFVGGTADMVITIESGMVIPTKVSCSEGSEAVASFEICPTQTAAGVIPMVATKAATVIPATAPQALLYTLGKAKLNGAFIDSGMTSMELDFGIQLEKIIGGDGIFPSFVAIQKRRPVLTITGHGIYLFYKVAIDADGMEEFGKDMTSGATIWYRAVKRSPGGHEPDATATHARFTMSKCHGKVDSLSGTDEDATATITIKPYVTAPGNALMSFLPAAII